MAQLNNDLTDTINPINNGFHLDPKYENSTDEVIVVRIKNDSLDGDHNDHKDLVENEDNSNLDFDDVEKVISLSNNHTNNTTNNSLNDDFNDDDDFSLDSVSTNTTTSSSATLNRTSANFGQRSRKRRSAGFVSRVRSRKSNKNFPTDHDGFIETCTSIRYKIRSVQREDHPESIFGVSFNQYIPKDAGNVFATCGDDYITIYQCIDSPSDGDFRSGFRPLVAYREPNDCFYCCAWSFDMKESGNPYIIAAGKLGLIRIIDVAIAEEIKSYQGHGGAINDLKIAPKNPNLLLSASKDHSIRLWNLNTDVCVAIFGGVEGHRDEVVSVDFHQTLPLFVSGGIDHSVKIWSLEKQDTVEAVKMSESFLGDINQSVFPTVYEHFPVFSTRDVHHNYIDCVQWLGDFLLTKSCQEELICWKPGKPEDRLEQLGYGGGGGTSATSGAKTHSYETDMNVTIIRKFVIPNCNVWFLRFALDCRHSLLAVGNLTGQMFLYDLGSGDPAQFRCIKLKQTNLCQETVRQAAFSTDGSTLIAVTDKSYVIRYDIKRVLDQAKQTSDEVQKETELANQNGDNHHEEDDNDDDEEMIEIKAEPND